MAAGVSGCLREAFEDVGNACLCVDFGGARERIMGVAGASIALRHKSIRHSDVLRQYGERERQTIDKAVTPTPSTMDTLIVTGADDMGPTAFAYLNPEGGADPGDTRRGWQRDGGTAHPSRS